VGVTYALLKEDPRDCHGPPGVLMLPSCKRTWPSSRRPATSADHFVVEMLILGQSSNSSGRKAFRSRTEYNNRNCDVFLADRCERIMAMSGTIPEPPRLAERVRFARAPHEQPPIRTRTSRRSPVRPLA